MLIKGSSWPDEFNRSQSQFHSPSPISVQKSENACKNTSQCVSNPFEVLYDSQIAFIKSNLFKSRHQPSKSASYIRIEEEIHSGTSLNASGVSRYVNSPPGTYDPESSNQFISPPAVTVINDNMLRRGTLVVSRLESLRRRNSIRLRNKMVHRHDIDPDSNSVFSITSSKKKRKRNALSFVFPIKRTTSFKYKPVSPVLHHKFDTQQNVNEYFLINNIPALMRDIIPRTMLTYKFKGLLKVEPTLYSHPEHFAISRAANFTRITSEGQRISTPYRVKTWRSQEISQPEHIPWVTLSEQERRQKFISTVNKEYRIKVFAGKYTVPPRLHEILPSEAAILTLEEKEAIETKLALEVLLRRTLAAKISYRINNSGIVGKSPLSSHHASPKSTSSSSDHSGPDWQYHQRQHVYFQKDNSENSERASSDTKELLKDIVPSEAFPSPQISYASHVSIPSRLGSSSRIFESHINRAFGNLDSIKETTEQEMGLELPRTRQLNQPPTTRFTTSSLYTENKDFGERNPQSRKDSEKLVNTQALLSPTLSDKFVNDFHQLLSENETRRQEENYHQNLSNLRLYSLKPMNRSVATFSSSGDLDFSDKLTSVPSETSHCRKQTEHELLSYTSSYQRGKRASRSTTGTSVMHSLENLTNSVNDYLVTHSGLQHITSSTFDASPDAASPGKQTTSSVYTESLSNFSGEVHGATVSVDSKSPPNLAMQTSHRILNLAQLYSLENIVLNLQREREQDNDIVGITYTSSEKEESNSRSSYKNPHSSGSLKEGQTQKSNSNNSLSSAYSPEAPLRTMGESFTKSEMS